MYLLYICCSVHSIIKYTLLYTTNGAGGNCISGDGLHFGGGVHAQLLLLLLFLNWTKTTRAAVGWKRVSRERETNDGQKMQTSRNVHIEYGLMQRLQQSLLHNDVEYIILCIYCTTTDGASFLYLYQ